MSKERKKGYIHKTWPMVWELAKELSVIPKDIPTSGKIHDSQEPGFWWFTCFCGKEWSPALRSFLAKTSRSCGCLRSTTSKAKALVFNAGDTFGRLTVVSKAPNIRNRGAYFCKCECGNVVPVLSASLVSSRIKSCGCLKQDNAKIMGESRATLLEPGQVFDRLTVIRRVSKSGARYECSCTCGNTSVVRAVALLNNNTRSCGCLARETHSTMGRNRLTEIPVGSIFGRLTVCELVRNDKDQAAYKCSCTCGKYVDILPPNLTNGTTNSCGCWALEKITENGRKNSIDIDPNTKFGNLLVVGRDGSFPKDAAFACKCDCGNDVRVRGSGLRSGNTKSCGCVRSFIENDLFQFVKELAPDAIKNTFDVIEKQLDVWIPSRNLAIELDGIYWHGEKMLVANDRHKLSSYHKYLACKEKGIRLILIFEDEWKKRQDAVKGYLRAILGTKKTVGARKCTLSKKNASEFIDQHHLQGSVPGETHTLSIDDKVVAAAVFSRTTKQKAMGKSGSWELTRYCLTPELSISGGLSRLLKSFISNHPECSEIVSYSDNRWSIGNMYKAAGFIDEIHSPPSFSYVKGDNRVHRFTFNKKKAIKKFGGSVNDTEWQIMARNGWDRIWDCGKTRWVYRPNLQVACQSP